MRKLLLLLLFLLLCFARMWVRHPVMPARTVGTVPVVRKFAPAPPPKHVGAARW